jgi:hypothetical protein
MHRHSPISPNIALVCALAGAGVFAPHAGESKSASHTEKSHLTASELAETRSFTASGVPGDALNIAFCGTEEDLLTLMTHAGWDPADAITWRSALHIAVASLRHRSYPDAPVSSLYVNGRKQDFAFEQELGDARRRHHVRLWKLDQHDAHGWQLWIGAATRDIGIGVSHTNGRPTHHIAPDIDAERDKLVGDVQATGGIAIEWIDEFQPASEGRNAGGDRFVTDRRLAVVGCR